MKKWMVALLAGISMAALLVSGCANKEAVRKEESLQSSSSVSQSGATKSVDSADQARLGERPAEKVRPAEQNRPAEQVRQAEQVPRATAETAVQSLMFEAVYFDFDKSELRQDARDVISKNSAVIMKAASGTKIQIEGHCDERGSAEYNLTLGESRAKSVLKYLTTLGVKADMLSIISYGKEKPAVQGSDEAAWSKNRRAEFVIVK